jgi:hypothetical protein
MAKQMLKEKGLDVRVVTTLHGTDITLVGSHPNYKSAVEFSINNSDVVTSVSNNLKETTNKLFNITKDIKVIYNFIDVKKYDNANKEDVKKKYKENIRPFEDLFLELGSIILKNASNFVAANPDAEMQRLHNQIRTEADKVKKGGDVKSIEKVEAELARLDRIGGVESIIPTEGLVFVYKGKTFKLTGTFAAINQLMGIIKYGR